ncbi:MAG: hypothetical protein A2806_02390 [Candidatus Terrybacteria bacterium RIFCSPHIGHO2_01_FULL_48_17]|uniref:Band 7 domain-containing protein n=1 Tax=Candidatus Terrybacteria bacterium RIFCSPHIGHO2_01_FULL_48_17 TaxID=1802362 RepID=A0A1G2PHV4_9BACT|nr:MAG: hypothetical protein A2806_02390 [Candidatus Terrybacteria bacterium RIFCSPHIGHO2_01_FULL_48_17]OHA53591.1 MAG: hypothetical protein A3A30_00345 [Candidatus Terrybacteria bacterium RIFCSPLOWO2_01_FULL_48_14]
MFLSIFFVPVVIFLFFLFAGIRIVNQYERGVVLTFGRYSTTLGPGLKWIFPIVQSMLRVDIRVATVDIPQQEVITRDNVPVGINAVVYFQVERAEDAVLKVQNYVFAIAQYAQGVLRDVIGNVELDTLLTEREKIAEEIKKIVDEATAAWGVNVTYIKIQDIELPADMKRAMAKQAESERERRGVIIKAEGELGAAENLKKAAALLSETSGGLTLRTLETIEKINPDPSKTVVFLLPVEIMEGIKNLFGKKE